MAQIHGFPAIADNNARILILGTMPGKASLHAGQYYANERNAFWGIIAALYGVPASAPYGERGATLRTAGIALWDVLRSCRRESSLDADIVAESIVPNDIAGFLFDHPAVRCVYFNGSTAESLYRKYVWQQLGAQSRRLPHVRLPSTSPAHACMRPAAKLRHWSVIKDAA